MRSMVYGLIGALAAGVAVIPQSAKAWCSYCGVYSPVVYTQPVVTVPTATITIPETRVVVVRRPVTRVVVVRPSVTRVVVERPPVTRRLVTTTTRRVVYNEPTVIRRVAYVTRRVVYNEPAVIRRVAYETTRRVAYVRPVVTSRVVVSRRVFTEVAGLIRKIPAYVAREDTRQPFVRVYSVGVGPLLCPHARAFDSIVRLRLSPESYR